MRAASGLTRPTWAPRGRRKRLSSQEVAIRAVGAGRHCIQVVELGDELRQDPGDRDAEGPGNRRSASEVRDQSEVTVAVAPWSADAQACDNVVPDHHSLTLRMLSGWRVGSPGSGERVAGGCDISGGPDVVLHLELIVNDEPATGRGQLRAVDQGWRSNAGRPDHGVRRHDTAIGQGHGVGGDLGDAGAESDFQAPLAEHLQREAAEARTQLGQHTIGDIQDQPADFIPRKVREPVQLVEGHQVKLRRRFRAGITGAHHNERQPRPPNRGISGCSHLELPQHVVVDIVGLHEGLQSETVLGQPRYRKDPGHTDHGQDEAVPPDDGRLVQAAQHGHRLRTEIDVIDDSLHDAGPFEDTVQGYRDLQGIEATGRDLGQQGAVTQVGSRADGRQLGCLGRGGPLDRARSEEPREPAADDHDPWRIDDHRWLLGDLVAVLLRCPNSRPARL